MRAVGVMQPWNGSSLVQRDSGVGDCLEQCAHCLGGDAVPLGGAAERGYEIGQLFNVYHVRENFNDAKLH